MKKYGFVLRTFAFGLSFIFAFYIFTLTMYNGDITDAVLLTDGEEKKTVCIVIDPGHGGMDGGAVSDCGILEKDVNLQISKRLYAFLQTLGIPCKITRVDDVSLDGGVTKQRKLHDLKNRVLFAKSTDGCVLLSIHQNKFLQKKYSGLQVYYSKNDPSSKVFADIIQSTVKEYLQNDNERQTKKATGSIYLLDNLSCPAVLAECGFLSNDIEAKKLNDSSYQKQLSLVLSCAVVRFLQIYTQ